MATRKTAPPKIKKPATRPVRKTAAITAKPDSSLRQLDLLRRLCEAPGVSGDESAVRNIVLQEIESAGVETTVDALGNLLVRCPAKRKASARVMVAAHMDEVGLMLTHITPEGLLKFEIVGGVDVRTLPATPVRVGGKQVPGVIGSKPVHLMEEEEFEREPKLESMAIDVGESKKDAAAAKAKPGDRAVFATPFRCERGVIRGKALDNRLGVATLIGLVLDPPAGIELLAAFTVQEEVGLRGAKVAAFALDPQLAFILDVTPANDAPMWDGSENTVYNTRLGAGPAVYLADRGTIYNPRLIRLLAETAEAKGIPFQYRQPGSGGTDAGAVHLARKGVPCAALSVPCRSIHTPNSTARLEDWLGQTALIRAALERLGKTTLSR